METGRYEQIEELLERFFEGQTSNQEEQELYRFFARKELPGSFQPYRSLFGYFEKGIGKETNERVRASLSGSKKERKQIPIYRKWWRIGLAVAASVCLLFCFNRLNKADETDFNPYAGSYIIHNGVKTEIPEEVARELYKAVLQSESAKSRSVRMALQSVRKQTEDLEQYLHKKEELELVEQHLHKMEHYEH